MMHALPLRVRVSRLSFALATIATVAASASFAQSPTGISVLQGFVMDSIHGTPLVDAKVTIEGTNRFGMTTAEGRYRVDSIPPGPHRVVVTHPMLDTAALQMRTPEYPFAAGKAHELDLAVPTGDRLVASMCNAAQRSLGPAAMVGGGAVRIDGSKSLKRWICESSALAMTWWKPGSLGSLPGVGPGMIGVQTPFGCRRRTP